MYAWPVGVCLRARRRHQFVGDHQPQPGDRICLPPLSPS